MLALYLFATTLSGAAYAGSEAAPLSPAVVVWMESGLPPVEARSKANRLSGGGAPLSWADIAYSRGDRSQEDRMRIDAVQSALDAARKRWDEFDVELGIAQALRTTIDSVALTKDDSDRNALVQALMFESTAVMRAFADSRFVTAEDAALFRVVVGDMVVSKPLVDLVALDPDRVWTREEVGDGQILARIEQYRAAVRSLPPGIVHFEAAPPGAQLVLDGRVLAADTTDMQAWPGHHYAHVQVGDTVFGRTEFDIASGATVSVPVDVDAAELASSKALVLEGTVEGLPADVVRALEALPPVNGNAARIYLAALNSRGHAHIVPWSEGAALLRPTVATFVLAGDVGGGIFNSAAFASSAGEVKTVPQFGPQLSGELGIYNLMINVGGTMSLTPTERFAFGGATDNPTLVPAGVRVWGGVGVYLPRPSPGKALFSLGVNYGMFFPGSEGFGGSLTFGVPISDGRTWLRLSLDGFRTQQMKGWPKPGSTNYAGAFRIGFGRLL